MRHEEAFDAASCNTLLKIVELKLVGGQECKPGQKKRKAAGGVHCLKLPLADLPELTCQNLE